VDSTLALVLVVVVLALIFDFINGFHDAANSIATIVATRVLSPFHAVLWAAFFNFVAVFTFGEAVAKQVGAGMVDKSLVTGLEGAYVILGGLVGGIVWNLLTWWWGFPSSSSHALIGGLGGAAMARVTREQGASHMLSALNASGWSKTLVFILVAPLLGLILSYVFMMILHWGFRHVSPKKMDWWSRRLQLVSSALFSFAHGTNDAQKTMGVIAAVLYAAAITKDAAGNPELRVDTWVKFAAHIAIGLGTMSGGWKIVKTMGSRLTRLKPRGGVCAETAAAVSVLFSSGLGMPVSTTHVIAGAIAGVGSIQRPKAVRWGLATSILWAWVFTIPASALVGFLCWFLVHTLAQ
jgi:inorganic phosphate transporter, PiT family